MKTMLKFDLHIHSKHSKDSLMDKERIKKIAQKKGLSGIAIADHDAMTDIHQPSFIVPGSEKNKDFVHPQLCRQRVYYSQN